MEARVRVSEEGDYIIITWKGEAKREDPVKLMQPILEAYELAKNLGIQQILVDVTEARNLQSPLHDYELVNRNIAMDPRINRSIRIALLAVPDDHSHDYITSITKNAGFNFKLFKDKTEALKFLRHG